MKSICGNLSIRFTCRPVPELCLEHGEPVIKGQTITRQNNACQSYRSVISADMNTLASAQGRQSMEHYYTSGNVYVTIFCRVVGKLQSSVDCRQMQVKVCQCYLVQTFVELAENAGFVEHLALVAMFVVVGDSLAQIPRQLPVDHVLLDLLELHTHTALAAKPGGQGVG